MEIGIIGIGTLTMEIARRAAQAGVKVIVNNPKGNNLVRETIDKMGPNIQLGNITNAASPKLVILFVNKADLEDTIASLPDMTGKIVIHTSGLIFNPQSLLTGISYAMTYKITAELLPNAHIVKLFKPIKLEIDTYSIDNKRDQIFYLTDNQEANNSVKILLNKLHFSPMDLSGSLQLKNLGYNDSASFTPLN